MGSRDPRRVSKRHGERLLAIAEAIRTGCYEQALETMRRVLGDATLPPVTRLLVTAQEVEALLAIGRHTEAFVRAVQAENMMDRNRLWHLRDQVASSIERARSFRGA